ncbi:MAG: chromate transporter [Planctomycetaceae bacterium]|nr:chromate transporter [Planctomycetaceae bacterium]
MHDDIPSVAFREALVTWCRVAALSFGGPAGQIAVMHRIIVDEKKWVSEERFLHALNYCMLLPGPEAQQLATYIGWLMHGVRGGLAAGILFIVPGIASILVLSVLYAEYQATPVIAAVFFGLKPAVMAIVVEAVIRIGKRVLKNGTMVALAALSFVAITLGTPFPVVILCAGLIGLVGNRFWPERFQVLKGHGGKNAGQGVRAEGQGAGEERTPSSPLALAPHASAGPSPRPSPPMDALAVNDASSGGEGGRRASLWRRSLVVSVICLSLWFAPLVALWAALGPDSVYVQEGLFFSKAALVTFGGAYSVLAYVAQQAVERFAWLQPGEMLDGLGMAETTPGPLIMVVQFVGFMGAYRDPGPLSPLAGGVLGSLITTWVTFVPCFFWIFLGAPFVERLRGNRALNSALSAITAAVVGVVLNLAVWFSVHTLFARVDTLTWRGLHVELPALSTFDWRAGLVAMLALVLTFIWKRGMITTLAACVAAGALLFALR